MNGPNGDASLVVCGPNGDASLAYGSKARAVVGAGGGGFFYWSKREKKGSHEEYLVYIRALSSVHTVRALNTNDPLLVEKRDSETWVLRFYGPPGPQMPGMKVDSDAKRKFFPD